jgi:hypothetical protein
MAIDVLQQGTDGYDAGRAAFNLRADQRPAAIAAPTSAAEVVETVEHAKAAGLRVAPQRTGHTALPLGDLGDSLLLKTTGLGGVEIDAGRRLARVGGGALWGDVVPRLSEQGLAALHGSTPTVSIAGYSLGGGVGWYGRAHGLACNKVRAIELVDAEGRERRVDADTDPELFWAMRGAPGDFGVVTALEFDLLVQPEVFAGALFFPAERVAEVAHAWRAFTETCPEEITSLVRVMNFPPLPTVPEGLRGKGFTIVEAISILPEAESAELLAPLRDLGPVRDALASQPPAGIAQLHMDSQNPVPYASTQMLLDDLPAAAVDAFAASAGPESGSKLVSVEIRHCDGALGRGGAGHGAMDRLPGRFMLFGLGGVPKAELLAPVEGWLGEVREAMSPWDAGHYLNYTDAQVDIGTAFPPATVERLRAAKAAYDPEDLFHANHPLGRG